MWLPYLTPITTHTSLAKGVETSTVMRMSEVVADVTGRGRSGSQSRPAQPASEVAVGQPAATVIGCADEQRAVVPQEAVSTNYRPYTNTDVIGRELGGAAEERDRPGCGMAAGVGLSRTRWPRSSPAAWPRRCGSALRPVPTSGRWRDWPASATHVARASPLSRNRTSGLRWVGARREEGAGRHQRPGRRGRSPCFGEGAGERHGVDTPLTGCRRSGVPPGSASVTRSRRSGPVHKPEIH